MFGKAVGVVTLKIICLVLVLLCGVCTMFVKKLLPVVLRRTPTDSEVLKFKALMFTVVAICALIIVIPDFVNF